MTDTHDWLRGCATALVTPFDSSGDLDLASLQALVARQLDAGIELLVPCGTTGEAATLSEAEQLHVIHATATAADGRARIIAGVGTNSTSTTVTRACSAINAGADGLLVVAPYYNRPSQAGLRAHFSAVADAAPGIPIMLYDVPGRTGVSIHTETILELARVLPNIVAVKDASGDLVRMGHLLRDRPHGFRVFAGDDALALPAIALGADGVVSVVANEAPALARRLVRAAAAGALDEARSLHSALLPLIEANFSDGSPAGPKAALALMGLTRDTLREPLVSVTTPTRAALREALHALRLIPSTHASTELRDHHAVTP